jgi:hypothetical protein
MRRPCRGLSLVEVMVAGSLLFMLSMVLYWVMIYAHADQRKHSSATTGQRAVGLALTRIEQRMLTARVQAPAVASGPVDQLVFEYVDIDEATGELRTEPDGDPIWNGPATMSLDAPSGVLRIIEAGEPPQVVANLGPTGEVKFERLGLRLLQVTVVAQETRPGDVTRSYRNERVAQIFIQNQTI